MGQVWFGTNERSSAFHTCLEPKPKPLPMETVPDEVKIQNVSLVLYKLTGKVLNYAGNGKLLYGYETKDLIVKNI